MIFKSKFKLIGVGLLFFIAIILLYLVFVFPKTSQIKNTNTIITSAQAENLIREEFNTNWKDIIDGCGLIKVLDLKENGKGYTATIEYGCGVLVPSKPNLRKDIFIDQSGKVTGIPKPRGQ